MISRTTIRKTLHYRQAHFLQKSTDTLQTLLVKALANRPTVKGRLENLHGDDDGAHRFINTNRRTMGFVFGSLVLYAEGVNKSIVVLDWNKKEVPLEHIAPPNKDDSVNREFLDSVLYVAVIDNHVVVLQSKSMRSQDLENYLNWFLSDSGVFGVDDQLELRETISKKTKKKLEKAHVKSVKVGHQLEASPLQSSVKSTKTKAKSVRYKPSGSGFDLLRAAIGEGFFKDLSLEDSLESSHLEVTLEVKYSYSTTDKAQALLDNVASSLRNLDKKEVVVNLKGGGQLTGDDLRISGPVQVAAINGIIDESDLYPKMRKFLMDQIEAGKLDP